MPHTTSRNSRASSPWGDAFAGALGLTGVLTICSLALTLLWQSPSPHAAAGPDAARRLRPAGAMAQSAQSAQSVGSLGLPGADLGQPCEISPAAFVRGELHGALAGTLDWTAPALVCDGMRKPDGIRLFFAHDGAAGGKRLAFVIGIKGIPDAPGTEHEANVTVIDEGDGKFFGSQGSDRCWVSVGRIDPLPGPRELRLEGILYCAGALPALNDRSSITLGDIAFAGRFADVTP